MKSKGWRFSGNARRGKTLYVLALSILAVAIPTLVVLNRAHSAPRGTLSAARIAEPNQSIKTNAAQHYGELPLSFEINKGQVDKRIKFLSHGPGYELGLTKNAAVLTLKRPVVAGNENDEATSKRSGGETAAATINLRMVGANRQPRIDGQDELPGKANYLIGNDHEKWRTNISTYAKVRYENVYPGIDLVYYGNRRQLEYDFVVAPGASPRTIRLRLEGAERLKIDQQGNLILSVAGSEVTLHKPVIYQLAEGGEKREVAGRYVIRGHLLSFQVKTWNRQKPLVIDPVLVYSTYLGGTGSDQGQAIAVDSSGSAFITGQTNSTNFPLVNPIQGTKGAIGDVFVTKLNPAGTAIMYSTFLGGAGADIGNGIALDSLGNAYVTGSTSSSDFPLANALHGTLSTSVDAFVVELNSSGSALVYSTYLGGSSFDSGNAIAVDPNGNALVTGETDSQNFPTTLPLQPNKHGSAAFKSVNGAANWNPSDTGLLVGAVATLAVDPTNTATIYAGADTGVYKTTNSGNSWTQVGSAQISGPVNQLAINPINPTIIYAATNAGVFKSTDGGVNWSVSNNGIPVTFFVAIAIDPVNPANLYVAGVGNIFFSTTDGGNNWTIRGINGASLINVLLVDPSTPSTIFAGTASGVFKSTNSGVNWTQANTGFPFANAITELAVSTAGTPSLYAAANTGIFRSTDSGGNWTNISNNLGAFQGVSRVTPDPNNAATIYVALPSGSFVYKTTDGGSSWNAVNTGYPNTRVNDLIVDPANSANLYIGTSAGAEAFVTKLSAGGTSQLYSTYLGGIANDIGFGVAVDADGNAYITGSTASVDFPLANAFQPVKGSTNEAFVTKLNSAGSALIYSTFLGGDGFDIGRAIAIDGSRNVYVTGATSSTNFPIANALQPAKGDQIGNDGFVTKLNSTASALGYSTYLGGSADDQGLGIAVDSAGNAYLTGTTSSPNFPLQSAFQSSKDQFTSDAFVAELTTTGSALVYSSYLGGNGTDSGRGIAVDSAGSAYVTGNTSSSNFPTASPFQAAYGGSTDAFVTKIRLAPDLSLTLTDSPDPTALGNNLSYTINIANGQELAATAVTVSDQLPASVSFVSASPSQGTCTGTTTVACNLGILAKGATATITIIVSPTTSATLTNTATVSSQEQDANPANNSAIETTTVTALPSISGRVLNLNATGFVAATVSLTGSQSKTIQTDDNGNYAFNDLPVGGNYTVTPSKTNHQFNPTTQTFNNLVQHQKANFTSLCSYTLSPLNQSFNAAGGTGSVTLTEVGSCGWLATSNAPWISITSAASGSGSATVSFLVAPATTGSRKGTLTIAGELFTVWQGFASCTACDFTVARNFDAGGSPGPSVVADFNNDGKPDVAALSSNVPPVQGGGGSDEGISVELGDGKGGFSSPSFVARLSAYQVLGIAAGDFNGDGYADLVVPTWAPSGKVNILLGDGSGNFGPATAIDVGSHPNNVAVGDVNGDGKADLAVTNENSHNVSILLGNGNGTFGPAVHYGDFLGIPYPVSVALTDLNGDSKVDFAVGNIVGIGIFLGDGHGSFAFSTNLFQSPGVHALAVSDLNGDGRPDLVAANGGLVFSLNAGGGTFGTFVSLASAGQGYSYVKTGDVNGDGQLDIVAGGNFSGNVSIFLNSGGGNFGTPNTYEAGNLTGIGVADFDVDGKLDVMATGGGIPVSTESTSFGTISLLRGLGNGKLEAAPTFATGIQPTFVSTADFNLDGKPDLAVATGSDFGTGALSILLGDGSGSFLPVNNFPVGTKPVSITVGDFNGDGKPDLTLANYTSSNISILLGDGAGGFGAATNITVGPSPRSIATADFNGDGKLDLAVTDTMSDPRGHVSIFQGNGSGGFAAAGGFFVNGGGPYALAVGDFNLDGRADVITVNSSNTFNSPSFVSVFKGDGAGSFSPQVDFSSSAIGGSAFLGGFNLVVDDFNGDGKLDAAVLDTGNNKIAVLLGNGKASFTSAQSFAVGSEPRNLTAGDFNSDGKPDLAVANWASNNVSVLTGDGAGDFSAPYFFGVGQYSAAVVAGDFNGDGKTDLAAANYGNGNVVLLLNNCAPLAGGSRITISGHITDNANGQALSRVSVSLTPVSSYTRTTKTDVNGNYVLPNVPSSDSYTVKASARFYTMNPLTRTIDNPAVNQTADFTATRLKYAITGRVVDFDGNGVAGVTITLGSPQGGPVLTTGADGGFSFSTLDAGYAYYVTPSKTGSTFDPLSYYFSSLEANQTAMFTISPDQVQFTNSLYSGSEGAGTISLPVNRTGDVSGTASVSFATSDGSARQSKDYTVASGTLTFGPGDTTKTIDILVTDNVYVDANRSLTVRLSNPGRATIGNPNPVTVFINDNDTTQPTTNPLDNSNAQFFVRQHYYDFLSRVPDPGGFGFWTGQITQCGSDQTCIRNKKIDVSNAFFYELEYQQTGSYVYRLYRAAFGSDQPFPNPIPDPAHPGEEKKVMSYSAFVQDRARVVGGADLAQAQLDLAKAFVLRPQFLTKYPANLDGTGFVDAILATIRDDVGADLANQRAALITLFNSGGRGAVLYRLADDNLQANPINNRPFIDAEYNRAFVATQYFGYLRRDADMGGFLFWLGQVSGAPLRDVSRQHAMVCSFITSAEYQQRFSSVVSHNNSECQP